MESEIEIDRRDRDPVLRYQHTRSRKGEWGSIDVPEYLFKICLMNVWCFVALVPGVIKKN